MSWSNWIYLGVGLGLGLGSRWLRRSNQKSGENEVISPAKSMTPASSDQQQVLVISEQLKQTQLAYQLAHEMSQFKAGFLARISHELRSPLNSLIGLHQLILSDLCDNPAEEREFVAQAHASALKLINLIDEILDVARTEHGTNKLEIQPLDLAYVLDEVYNLTHLLAANRNFPLQVSPPEPETYILADPRWLRQVLTSLINTSISQMQEGRICISSQAIPTEKYVHIWLDLPLSTSLSEPINLMADESDFSKPSVENITSPFGLTLLLNQTVLEVMNSSLEILPTTNAAEHSTRMQLTIPLVIPETGSLEPEAD